MEVNQGANGNGKRIIGYYARRTLSGTNFSIVRPRVANNFKIKPSFFQMVRQMLQFDGLQDEDPNAHIATFLEICDTLK
jgi:hypothetical protein